MEQKENISLTSILLREGALFIWEKCFDGSLRYWRDSQRGPEGGLARSAWEEGNILSVVWEDNRGREREKQGGGSKELAGKLYILWHQLLLLFYSKIFCKINSPNAWVWVNILCVCV